VQQTASTGLPWWAWVAIAAGAALLLAFVLLSIRGYPKDGAF
jgi:hypothetical protein